MRAILASALAVLAAALPASDIQAQSVAAVEDAAEINSTGASRVHRPARLQVEGVPLSVALTELSERSGVAIAFSPTRLAREGAVDCDCLDLTVAQALERLLACTRYRYAEVEGHVVVIPAPASRPGRVRDRLRDPPPVFATFLSPKLATLRESAALRTRQGTITGRVLDAQTRRPISGAQVYIAALEIGGLSRADGRYTLTDVPAGTHTLRGRMLGYAEAAQSVSVLANETVQVDFELTETALRLDEIVVTGTAGQARRREVAHSVTSLDSRQLERKPVTTLSDVLQAEVPGLTQLTGEGQVGASAVLRLRGNTSILGGNAPLIYVDGVRLTTRRPVAGQGSAAEAGPLDNLNPADIERIEVVRGAAASTIYGTEANSGVIQIFTKRGSEVVGPTWDLNSRFGTRFLTANALGPVVGGDPTFVNIKPWLKQGRVNDHSLSVTGASGEFRYYLSGEISDGTGVMPTQGSKRGGFRTNIGLTVFDGLMFEVNSSFVSRETSWIQAGDNANAVLLNLMRQEAGNVPAGQESALFDQSTTTNDRHYIGALNTTLSTGPISHRLTLGLEYLDRRNEFTREFGHVLRPDGQRVLDRWRNTGLTLDYMANWRHDLSPRLHSVLAWGYQAVDERQESVSGNAFGFPGPGPMTLGSAATSVASETSLKTLNLGFFVQEQLGFRDLAFFTLGVRVDGNSAFGSDFGLQAYPKVSATYIPSDHAWWPEWMSGFRLRTALGESGKAPNPLDSTRRWNSIRAYGDQAGVTPGLPGSPNLGPERTQELEVGLDAELWNGRLAASGTWYDAVTRDLLWPAQLPPSEGFTTAQPTNIGKIKNTGLEIELRGMPILTPTLSWETRLHLATMNSEVLDLAGGRQFFGSPTWRTWVQEGFPVPAHIGPKVQNPDEIADPIFDEEFYGPTHPTSTWGLSSTVTLFGRLSAFALLEAQLGHFVMSGEARQNAFRGVWPQCQEREATMDEQTAIWRARCSGSFEWASWIFPGDNVKLRTITLSYDLPVDRIPLNASRARLSLSGHNLWKWTDYPGLDPEGTAGAGQLQRRGFYSLPPLQSITLGLSVGF